ncbi:hypothetical protein [Bacillus sp. SG-1]|uniref:hypothetical protein n=1 Tax=Bacillus sp. SG-1 TaxID=161544 RepID=UPI0002EDE76B|nr:hypothetical protein [Bacillus sp. SG-1]
MKSTKLRMAWITLNIFCYVMLMGVSLFVAVRAEGLADINRLSVWVVAVLCLLFVSVFGSVQLYTWMNNGDI